MSAQKVTYNDIMDSYKYIENLLIVIMIKLSIMFALKIVKACSKLYEKHNNFVLEKNLIKMKETEDKNIRINVNQKTWILDGKFQFRGETKETKK